MKTITRLLLCFVLSFVFIEAPLTQNKAYAGMITTQQVVNDLSAEKSTITVFMQRDDVKQQLVKLGVTAEEANNRIASLSEAEVQEFSAQINQVQAGGFLVAILVIILIIFVVVRI